MSELRDEPLPQLLRLAWENGIGYGYTGGDTDYIASLTGDDTAFAEWIAEHALDMAGMLAEFGGQMRQSERDRLAGKVRGLFGPQAWRRFRMKHGLGSVNDTTGDLIRAIVSEIEAGWME